MASAIPPEFLYDTGARDLDRRLLLVSAAFPPSADVGAMRWEGFAPYLVDAGWGVDVLMEHPSTLSLLDWERPKRLPPGITVHGVPRSLPSWFSSLMRVRRLAGVAASGREAPELVSVVRTNGETSRESRATLKSRLIDAAHRQRDESWLRRASELACRSVTKRHRVIISSGPPQDAHVAAHRAAVATGLPHLVDLRDPWDAATSPVPGAARDVGADEAAQVLRHAALVLANTESMRRVIAERFPDRADRIIAVPNGSDMRPEVVPPHDPAERFIVAHAGSLYLDRDPRPLLRAVARLREDGVIDERSFRLVFMGDRTIIDGRSLTEWADDYGITDLFEMRARGTREAARDLLRSAAMTLVFQGQTTTQIPAKVYEYVAFPAWILALVGDDSATADMLRGTHARVLELTDEAGIAKALCDAFATFRASGRPAPAGADGRFSRATQAERLLAALDRLRS